jgi:hypothetical protein
MQFTDNTQPRRPATRALRLVFAIFSALAFGAGAFGQTTPPRP